MATKLRKTFETKPDHYGFRTDLDVKVNYDQEGNTIDSLRVTLYSERIGCIINITDLFETVPELQSLVDNIDWNDLARQEEVAKEEEVYDEA